MPLAASVLLVTSMTLAGADPEAERVIGRLRDHFERLHSIHIRAVDRKLKAGGLWTQNPAEEKPVYDPSFTREYDIWFDPPKIRLFQTGIYHHAGGAQETSRVAIYFDGSKYTHLDMISRSGFQIKGGSHLQPPITGPLHALGYCFPMTYGTSLGQLLTNPSQLEVHRGATGESRTEWIIHVKTVPKGVRPTLWSEHQHSRTQVRIWAAVDPEVVLHRWALYLPRYGDLKKDAVAGKRIPMFELEGLLLNHAFLNCYESNFRAKDELRGRDVLLPRRILHGHGNQTTESLIQEVVINPRATSTTFLPELPPGFLIDRRDEPSENENVATAPARRSAERPQAISQEALTILSTGHGLRAQERSAWTLLLFCAALILCGLVTLLPGPPFPLWVRFRLFSRFFCSKSLRDACFRSSDRLYTCRLFNS